MKLFDRSTKATLLAGLALLAPVVDAAMTCEEQHTAVSKNMAEALILSIGALIALRQGHYRLGLMLLTVASLDLFNGKLGLLAMKLSNCSEEHKQRYTQNTL